MCYDSAFNRRGDVVFYPSDVHTSKLVAIISVSLKPRGSMFFFLMYDPSCQNVSYEKVVELVSQYDTRRQLAHVLGFRFVQDRHIFNRETFLFALTCCLFCSVLVRQIASTEF